MLYRVSGKLEDGRSFSQTVDASNSVMAVAAISKALTDAKANPAEIHSKQVKAKPELYIGEARTPKSGKKGDKK